MTIEIYYCASDRATVCCARSVRREARSQSAGAFDRGCAMLSVHESGLSGGYKRVLTELIVRSDDDGRVIGLGVKKLAKSARMNPNAFRDYADALAAHSPVVLTHDIAVRVEVNGLRTRMKGQANEALTYRIRLVRREHP